MSSTASATAPECSDDSKCDAAATGLVLLYYAYVPIPDVEGFVDRQRLLGSSLGLTGRIRVASEGINGSVAGSHDQVHEYVRKMSSEEPCLEGHAQGIDWKFSDGPPNAKLVFEEFNVRACSELVGLDAGALPYDPSIGGTHLGPVEFHRALDTARQDEYVLIDVRNSYEYAVGHFETATDPQLRSFSQFPAWVKDQHDQGLFQNKAKVLMYCTGGIRCEKASQVVKSVTGMEDVYQLRGGIHRYIEHFGAGGMFQGRNFVFDKRVLQPVPTAKDTCTDDSVANHSDGGGDVVVDVDVKVVGRCSVCAVPHEEIDPSRRCSYCRILVLACDDCTKSRDLLWCAQHDYFDSYATDAEATLSRHIEQTTQAKIKLNIGQPKQKDRLGKNRQIKCKGQVKALKKQMVVLQQQLDKTRSVARQQDVL